MSDYRPENEMAGKKFFSEGNELYFAKVRPEAKVPTKKDENAGYDIYSCFNEEELFIPAHSTKLVPTGIAAAVSSGYYLQVEERGSTGSKGIKKSAGVVDSGYRGEIFIAVTNANDCDVVITKLKDRDGNLRTTYHPTVGNNRGCIIMYPYEKAIAQLIVHRVPEMDVREISYEDLKAIPSERGTGALGSSGK